MKTVTQLLENRTVPATDMRALQGSPRERDGTPKSMVQDCNGYHAVENPIYVPIAEFS